MVSLPTTAHIYPDLLLGVRPIHTDIMTNTYIFRSAYIHKGMGGSLKLALSQNDLYDPMVFIILTQSKLHTASSSLNCLLLV